MFEIHLHCACSSVIHLPESYELSLLERNVLICHGLWYHHRPSFNIRSPVTSPSITNLDITYKSHGLHQNQWHSTSPRGYVVSRDDLYALPCVCELMAWESSLDSILKGTAASAPALASVACVLKHKVSIQHAP